MSILPLSSISSSVIGMFGMQLPVREAAYTNIAGEDKQTLSPSRSIFCAVDASSPKQLELIFGRGSVSDGDIGIYTQDRLYILDQGATKQSFVSYNGTQYKVVAENDWTEQAQAKVYLARRHVIQDLL